MDLRFRAEVEPWIDMGYVWVVRYVEDYEHADRRGRVVARGGKMYDSWAEARAAAEEWNKSLGFWDEPEPLEPTLWEREHRPQWT